MFHLGWFLGDGFGIHPWRHSWAGSNGSDWMKPRIYTDLAASLERAGFDLMFIEDTSMVEDSYKGSMETALKYGLMAPKNDPMPLVPLIAAATRHLGVVSTMSTIQYPPFLGARLMTTLDHLTEGRAGVNIVTSVTHRVAQNFGLEQHMAHAERYEMAMEWMDVVTALWESWEPDAVLVDQDSPRYADHTKVHTIDFEGKYFKCRGPLNTIPGPQGRPVVAQAGNSEPGRDLAAKHADTMLALARTPSAMKELRSDMNARLLKFGRKPEDLKILFMTTPWLAETDDEAKARWQRNEDRKGTPDAIEEKLWGMSYASGGEIDYSRFDLDGPVPTEVGNGETTSAKAWMQGTEEMTLRQLITGPSKYGMEFIGTPESIAAEMDDVMQEAGGDGFLVYSGMTRHSIALVTDGLAPALRRRGAIRAGYEGETFRENLLAF